MLGTTLNIIRESLKGDPSISPQDRVQLLGLLRNGPAKPDPVPTTVPECRIIRRAEAAHRLSRSLRSVDLLAKTGVLRKLKFPGRTRAAGFLSTEIDRLIVGKEAAQ